MNDVLSRIVERWRLKHIDLLPAANEEQLKAVWHRLDGQLSADVTAFYGVFGGYVDADMDDRHLSLWPVEKIVTENEIIRIRGVLFAYFLAFSHGYYFKFESPSTSSVWVDWFDGRDEQVAVSVEDFLVRYLDDPISLWL